LLTTTGARTGRTRTVPLLYLADGDRLILVASNGSRPHHPAWYYNLKAHPQVQVAIRGRSRTYLAHEASAVGASTVRAHRGAGAAHFRACLCRVGQVEQQLGGQVQVQALPAAGQTGEAAPASSKKGGSKAITAQFQTLDPSKATESEGSSNGHQSFRR
jgi:deazaflavin-dependent oxidoreductase (nitroreductase family)